MTGFKKPWQNLLRIFLMRKQGSALYRLKLVDSELALEIETHLSAARRPIEPDDLETLTRDTLWALSHEIAFGKAVAIGYAQVLANRDRKSFAVFRAAIRKAGQKGPTIGKIFATHLVPVFLSGDKQLVKLFLRTERIMRRKGTYTLSGPLTCLSKLLNEGDVSSGHAFLELLCNAYDRDMTYNQSLQLTYSLPKAVSDMSPQKRPWLMAALSRIIKIDLGAAECFLEGLKKGLAYLHQKDLDRFVSMGLARYARDQKRGCRFMALGSKLSQEICGAMQVAVPLSQIQNKLSRYVRTRTGRQIAIRPMDQSAPVRGQDRGTSGRVSSDEGAIYLPSEIDVYASQNANRNLYSILVKFESACLEFGTFDFDAEKALACFESQYPEESRAIAVGPLSPDAGASELGRFLNMFEAPELAAGLFNIFEHARQRLLLSTYYPGIVHRALPIMQREMIRIMAEANGNHVLNQLYARVALDMDATSTQYLESDLMSDIQGIQEAVIPDLDAVPLVETCGVSVLRTYAPIKKLLRLLRPTGPDQPYRFSVQTPFGRILKLQGHFHVNPNLNRLAASIQSKLRKKGITVYRMDVRKKLAQNNAKLSRQDLRELIAAQAPHSGMVRQISMHRLEDLHHEDGFDLRNQTQTEEEPAVGSDDRVASYHEWDFRLADYLPDYVRVVDRTVKGVDDDFYADTLKHYHGLIHRTRQAFELLRPEGMSMMRQWHEGDQFDYRALIDFALDRRLGRIPTDRLYIKRDKRQRDVAVLVLVDLSKSTSNLARGATASVLEIEKAALVLLSEALAVAGDRFALVGFSGSGRFNVDYWRIKNFSDQFDHRVHRRINAISPLRSTRMGAAIRHAANDLAGIQAKVRLLLVLTDGYPNDVGYKQAYALADTQRAVFEAHAQHIFFKAIVVNIAGEPNLDALYGKYQHTLISNIPELPDKLLRIYGSMTRM